MERYLRKSVESDLKKKMVFVGGPRQVGKTTLATQILGSQLKNHYLNWDIDEDRERILKGELPSSGTIVFDEIHKYRLWRRLVKGLYDKSKISKYRPILVTGSARLDYYRYGGDSLQGRYFYYRLHPITLAELKQCGAKELQELFHLGGFPEPFLSGSKKESKRWSRDYRNRLIKDDIIPIEQVSDIGKLEKLMLYLPRLVGSPLSLNNLREDLEVAHKTVARWLDILERFYGIFRLAPFGGPRLKAVKKLQKHYHYDWTLVEEESHRFENLVASHLLKWVHYRQDTEGSTVELKYYQDLEKREVDFVITENDQPLQFIECKWTDAATSPQLVYLKKKFPKTESYQISFKGKKDFLTPLGIRHCPAHVFLKDFV